MSGEPITTLCGNVAGEPQLKVLPSGTSVLNFTLAQNTRVKDGDAWKDGETIWVRCAVWRQPGENAAESIDSGTRVIALGRLKTRSWEKDGVKQTGLEMDVDELGVSTRYATARATKVERSGGGFGERRPTGTDQIQTGGGYDAGDPWGAQSAEDPAPF